MNAAIAGLTTGLSLIVAIGAQNAAVLRLGLQRSGVAIAVAICIATDCALIAAGTAGFGTVVHAVPAALDVLPWLGVAYLLVVAVRSFRAALRGGHLDAAASAAPSTRAIVVSTLGFTFLNPHVYVDTVLLLGSVSSHYGSHRWWFALGAATGSVLWFSCLGFGARLVAPLLGSDLVWRVVDVVIGCVMVVVAISLATTHVN